MSSNLPVHEFDLWERTLKAPTRNPDYNGYTEVDDDFIQELWKRARLCGPIFIRIIVLISGWIITELPSSQTNRYRCFMTSSRSHVYSIVQKS